MGNDLLSLIIVAAVLYWLWSANKREPSKEETPQPHQDQDQNEFVFVNYRSHILCMRRWEKEKWWDVWNRDRKNEHLEGVKKAVKRGEVKVEKYQDGWLYLPVSGKNKQALEQWNEFKRLGGVPQTSM